MKKNYFLILPFILSVHLITAQLNGKLKIYFTNPVNNSVSSGSNAIYLNSSMDDSLVAYIDRAKYTLDIAIYNYQQSSTGMANIATAINNAITRGVAVRWIYDGSQSNSGMATLSPSVQTLASPTTSNYGIMHNKFMIIDANSSNTNDAMVWTGSTNWTKTHFNSNVNNTIIVQDQNFALAFWDEFNEMWGSTSLIPNTSNSKFGPYKSNNTAHTFTIGGKVVELYFSPTDGTQSHIFDAIEGADTDMYFGMLTFSVDEIADSIVSEKNKGVYVAGAIDQSSQLYTPNSILTNALGNNFKVYSQFTSVYHDKVLIVDPSNTNSDPTVITGSYNWSNPAESTNDENAVIIHDAEVANIYYQSFHENFTTLGGNLSSLTGFKQVEEEDNLSIYPTINNGLFYLSSNNISNQNIQVDLYNSLGEKITTLIKGKHSNNVIQLNCAELNLESGVYFVKIKTDLNESAKKIILQH